jgi:hypothetical protein
MMAITIHRVTYFVATEADVICLVAALELLQALARREGSSAKPNSASSSDRTRRGSVSRSHRTTPCSSSPASSLSCATAARPY